MTPIKTLRPPSYILNVRPLIVLTNSMLIKIKQKQYRTSLAVLSKTLLQIIM